MFARRAASLLFTLWFALFVDGPRWLAPCPTHDLAAVVAAVDGAAHESHGSQAPADDEHEGSHRCDCPGPSCGSGTAAIVPLSITAPDEPPSTAHRGAAAADIGITPVAAAHLLPFANGPPAHAALARVASPLA